MKSETGLRKLHTWLYKTYTPPSAEPFVQTFKQKVIDLLVAEEQQVAPEAQMKPTKAQLERALRFAVEHLFGQCQDCPAIPCPANISVKGDRCQARIIRHYLKLAKENAENLKKLKGGK